MGNVRNRMIYGLLFLLFIFTSCKDNSIATRGSDSKMKKFTKTGEIAFPNITGKDIKVGGIGLVKKGKYYIFQGDIILTNRQVGFLRRKKIVHLDSSAFQKQIGSANLNNQSRYGFDSIPHIPTSAVMNTFMKLWPKNTIYYSISSSYNYPTRINSAIHTWESNTYLDFKLRTDQNNYIEFVPGDGCSSRVGMIGGKQKIILDQIGAILR